MRLALESVHFNPAAHSALTRNLFRYVRQMEAEGYPIFLSEIAFDEKESVLGSASNVITFRASRFQALWHKENLINLAEKTVPPEYDAIAWIDADVWFQRLDWYEAACEALETRAVIQLFREHVFTGEDGRPTGRRMGVAAGGSCTLDRFHPGLAWAARRTLWTEAGGLYDGGILGAGDMINGAAWLPGIDLDWLQDPELPGHLARLRQWAADNGGCGYIDGTIWHEWHGSGKNRQFGSCCSKLHLLDRSKHLRRRPDGLLEWTEEAPKELRRHVQNYFLGRQEDGVSRWKEQVALQVPEIRRWRLSPEEFPHPHWRNTNPSVLFHAGQGRIVYRSFPCEEENGETPYPGRLVVAKLSEDLISLHDHREISGLRGQQQEDGRLFVHDGRMHLAYTAAHYEIGWEWESRMELARLSEDGTTAECHYPLPHGTNGAGREKNWQFFTDEGCIRFVYSLSYHVVMEVGSDRKWGDLDTPKWHFGSIGGGTPPVRIGDEWLSFFHSWEGNSEHSRRYHVGAYTFRKGDYKITRMTPGPLLSASEDDGFVFDRAKCRWHPLCVFPAGADYNPAKDEWLVSMGVNDSWCEFFSIKGQELMSFMQPAKWFAQGQGAAPTARHISMSSPPNLDVVTLWRPGWTESQDSVVRWLGSEVWPDRTRLLWSAAEGCETAERLEHAWDAKLKPHPANLTCELVAQPSVAWRNQAQRHALIAGLYSSMLSDVEAEYTLIVEDDVEAPTGTVDRLFSILLSDPALAAVMGGYQSRTRPCCVCATGVNLCYIPWPHGSGLSAPCLQRPRVLPATWVGGGCTLFRTSALRGQLPVEPDFSGEWVAGWDRVLCRGLRKAGWAMAVDLGVAALHRCPEVERFRP